MSDLVIHNARVFCGVDEEVLDNGTVWVSNGLIKYAGSSTDVPEIDSGVERYDAEGKFVMPGMTESHVHLSYNNAHPQQLNNQPLPIAMLDAVDNARVLLGSGFTSAISFGSAQGLDIPLRDAINAGRVPGPRLAASDRDLGSTGSNADGASGGDMAKKIIADGPWAIRKAVRSLAKKRCDIVKIFLDGEAISAYAPPGVLTYSDEEVEAAVSEAHIRGMRIVSHSRSAESVKQAVRHGVDIIGHANYLDDEAVAMLEAERHRIFVGPGIAWEIALLDKGAQLGLPREDMERLGYQREIDETISSVKRLRESKVRVLIGGDYGLNITPHGTNAKDLEYFVDLFGMSDAEALLCATRDGGAAANTEGMVGTLEEGKYADLVVVDGDPTIDVRVLQDHDNIVGVMKNGVMHCGLMQSNPYVSPFSQ
ncbi:MAG: amidohydrolase family protein [Acidimicrobiales bacterium]|jgi:imidazolonepropionase-like amidohydrolase|nr:amidohydrolase family protein [Acidimicrobiales bacterium]MDP6298563.1 amidohydrolase family protein [Acidimicrobiales bacterium]HJM29128.1 amidohydrolase family protein [Acidimicrobiales bacterium]HJM97444.1 amidohydrolase family protein [Acidimicrobiales bacterium]